MSVPVNKRSHGELEVNVMARELCAYTLRITANPKKFPVDQKSFTEKIRDVAIDIYTLCWEANNIKVDNRMDRYLRRIELQEIAADKCNTLCALIEISKPLFHLSSKRCAYWIDRTVNLRAVIRAWANSDIKGYYPNMPHDVAEQTFRAVLPDWSYERVVAILRGQYDGDRGYNPGSQLVQIAGISVLNPLDHYIKEQLHVKLYLRYMDDFILIHPDREYLEQCQIRIVNYLKSMGFDINEKKTRIFQLKEGIDFLGFTFRATETGKVLMLIQSKNVKAQRRKLRRMVAKSKRGGIPRPKVDEAYAAWRNHASKGNSYRLLRRMDEYYRHLWKDDVYVS